MRELAAEESDLLVGFAEGAVEEGWVGCVQFPAGEDDLMGIGIC